MACWMTTTSWSLKTAPLSPSFSTFKFKCCATQPQPQPQPQCSSVHNDDLQALLQAHHLSSSHSIPQHSNSTTFFLTSLFFYSQILPSDLHHNLLNQPNRTHLLEVFISSLFRYYYSLFKFNFHSSLGYIGFGPFSRSTLSRKTRKPLSKKF